MNLYGFYHNKIYLPNSTRKSRGDMLDLYTTAKRVIVCHVGKQIKVIDADDRSDLKEGDWIKLINEVDIMN